MLKETNSQEKYKYYKERTIMFIKIFLKSNYPNIYSLLKQIKSFSRNIIKFFGSLLLNIFGTIAYVNTEEPVAALTFDDGPHPVYTPNLLKILDKYKAHATFFMVGEAAQRQQELVKKVAQAGHAIGIHSWDHSSFATISGRKRRQQLRACKRTLGSYGQRLFRPPWGKQNLASRLDALWLGYKVVGWNVVAKDWFDFKPSDMAERLIKDIKPGSIILLHDAIYRSSLAIPQYDRSAMLEALDIALTQISNQMRFVTVPELLQYGRPALQKWFYK
jgi:peptidoglycan-N-acetylglucosamine deacetylase